MATYYFKSCCDSNTTFIITDLSTLTGDFYHVIVPNYFSGCTEIISSGDLIPGSPTYSDSELSITLTEYSDCQTCNQTYPCVRITGVSECDVITLTPLNITCSANSLNSTITINITGGTPPYKVQWSNGFIGQTLTNAVPGINYTAVVTDYSWGTTGPDFTATTVCSIPLPTPTPSVTPTPTPTPPPVNTQSLCLYLEQNGVITSFNFSPTPNYVNGKPTWSSSTYTLQWNLTPQPSWQVVIGSNFIYSTNPNSPIGSYTTIGPSGRVNMTNGPCTVKSIDFKRITIQPPICEKTPSTGSIYIDLVSAVPPVLYSINGGLTTQLSPLFTNLNSGNYDVWVQDGTSTIITQTVNVPQPPQQTTYYLSFNSSVSTINSTNKTLNFTLQIVDGNGNPITSLPSGTQISFNILQSKTFSTTILNAGYTTNSILIKKNGIDLGISPTEVTTTTTTPVNNQCGVTQSIKYTTGVTKTYSSIIISGTDVITGSINVLLTQTTPGNVCILESLDKFIISGSSLTGCSCCSVISRNPETILMKTSPNK